MCGLILSTRPITDEAQASRFLAGRGPDHTSRLHADGFHFLHYLLNITGPLTPQPLRSSDGECLLMFNGEIYNHREFGAFENDGECLIPLYREHGAEFVKLLDGEFAIVLLDLSRRRLVLSTDTFGTKPLWFAIEDDEIGVSSYATSLFALGFRAPRQLGANSIIEIDVHSRRVASRDSVTTFDTRQYKRTFDDWIAAFGEAVRKRGQAAHKIFVGLSSGYDSGAIVCELLRQELPFQAYSVAALENMEILEARHRLIAEGELMHLSKDEIDSARCYLSERCEPYEKEWYSVQRDHGALGCAVICERARRDGCRILLSGQGADEIISDYGWNGEKYVWHSEFGGFFPEDLGAIFPYRSFFGGTQQLFLAKDEIVAGSFGIETRYPFLDRALVQEFLALDHRLKNVRYKAPLHELLVQADFPFEAGVKIPFFADQNHAVTVQRGVDAFGVIP